MSRGMSAVGVGADVPTDTDVPTDGENVGDDDLKIGLIWAEADGVIGNDGVMPWHLPEDLAHFKQLTLGSPVIMGRKTWDSLNPRFRPLPGRRNIVVTRQVGWHVDGVDTAHSVDEALDLAAVAAGTSAASSTGLSTAPSTAMSPVPVSSPVAADPTPAAATDSGVSVWVIGGAEIFAGVIDRSDRLEVTEISTTVDGDTRAPVIDDRWSEADRDPVEGWHTSRTGLDYRFIRYLTRAASATS
jgi:dihydrofolate reductase